MFSSFVAFEDNSPPPRSRTRRNTVARACVTCQRRKVKCNGVHPCSNCRACKSECVFVARRRRTGEISGNKGVQDYQTVFSKLFGDASVKSVIDLPRESLLDLLNEQKELGNLKQETSPQNHPTLPSPLSSTATTDAIHRLETLEDRPAEGFEWDESSDHLREVVEDDVNGLALSSNRKSSFLGLSSVPAAVKVLAKALPSPSIEDMPSFSARQNEQLWTISLPEALQSNSAQGLPYHEGQRLIDSYFTHIHVFAPMIHEQTFRVTYLSNERTDSSWLALLNMVFAMGSVAASGSDSDQDIIFYHRARQHLGLESLGSGHMETLQALTLMGGMYLHYRNRPNLASALLGAAIRIACSLGLHREFHSDESPLNIEREVNRRTWWSIFILDSWGSTTLGRPLTCDENGTEIPKNMIDDRAGDAPCDQATIYSPLIHSISFCKVVARIQRRLQTSPILTVKEISTLDQTLVDWFDGLPSFMRAPNTCPSELQDIRAILKWRCLNMRMILHRGAVLDMTERRVSISCLDKEDQEVVKRCREIAAESIFCIQAEWRPCKLSGWNGVWFLFQACLVPLMALAVESEENENYCMWQEQVLLGVQLCGEMDHWSLVGHKTKEALERLFEASKKPGTEMPFVDELANFESGDISLREHFFGGSWNDIMGDEYFTGLGTGSTLWQR